MLPKNKPKLEPEENKFMFKVFLLNGLNLTLQLEDVIEKMSVAEFVRIVRRKEAAMRATLECFLRINPSLNMRRTNSCSGFFFLMVLI